MEWGDTGSQASSRNSLPGAQALARRRNPETEFQVQGGGLTRSLMRKNQDRNQSWEPWHEGGSGRSLGTWRPWQPQLMLQIPGLMGSLKSACVQLLELGVHSQRRWGLNKQRIVLSQVLLLTLKSPKHKKASCWKEHVEKGESKPLQAYRRGTENINRRLNFISIIKPNLKS